MNFTRFHRISVGAKNVDNWLTIFVGVLIGMNLNLTKLSQPNANGVRRWQHLRLLPDCARLNDPTE